MHNNITRLILWLISIFCLCVILTYKFLGKKTIFIGILITLLYTLFSKNILVHTVTKCIRHVNGKKIFQLAFPFCYNIFNPSIVKIPFGYLLSVRCSTLSQKNIFCYLYGQFFYDSSIFFIELDIKGKYKIFYPNDKGNLEDPRMIKYKNQYILSDS